MGNLNQLTDLVRAVTGWNTSLWELGKVAERSLTLPQLFNVRAGLTPEQDRLPARLFEAPSPGSTAKAIDPVQLESAKRLYYAMCGWDPLDGVPTYAKLIELGLGDFTSP
jgi:aldehyde:ferredoxin oxidoreductase